MLSFFSCAKSQTVKIEDFGLELEIPKGRVLVLQEVDNIISCEDINVAKRASLVINYPKKDLSFVIQNIKYHSTNDFQELDVLDIVQSIQDSIIIDISENNLGKILYFKFTENEIVKFSKIQILDINSDKYIFQILSSAKHYIEDAKTDYFFSSIKFL